LTPSAQRSGFSANQRWRFLGLTALFCVGIAILVWAIGDASFGSSLAVSLCIGLSINGTFMVFGSYLERFMNPYVSAIPLVAIGLCIGMLLGGTLVMRDPLYLFADDNTTLVLGVFFGVVALRCSARERAFYRPRQNWRWLPANISGRRG
jgi:O-antigen/teichoic acid export membrane protein